MLSLEYRVVLRHDIFSCDDGISDSEGETSVGIDVDVKWLILMTTMQIAPIFQELPH